MADQHDPTLETLEPAPAEPDAPGMVGMDESLTSLPFEPYRMMAIDVGSNAIRHHVWELTSEGSARKIADARHAVRLGQSVFATGMLSEDIIETAMEAFTSIRKEMDRLDVHSLRAVATSAMREASNSLVLVRRLAKEVGIQLEILPALEEARLIALGILGSRRSLREQYMLIDIGGGSTEVIVARDVEIEAARSLRLGAVRLTGMFFKQMPPGEDEFELARDHIEYVFQKALNLPALEDDLRCLGNAGTINTLNLMAGGGEGSELMLDDVRRIVGELRTMSREKAVKKFGIDPERAEIILAGGLVLQSIMERAGVDSLEQVRGGVGDGMLQDFMERVGLRRSRLFDHDRTFLAQARALGEHYRVNRAHAEQVAKLAVSIFDQTETMHELGAADRTLLKGAALLLDIGQYVAYAAHHKHTLYLLQHADLPGLSATEKQVMACVARYHRKAHPKPSHEAFRTLSSRDRERVRKLAAIVRIADALDREHQSRVSQVKVTLSEKRAEFHIVVHYEAAIEVWSAAQKASLFKEVYRREPEFFVVHV